MSAAESVQDSAVIEALRGVVDPELAENVVELGMVRSVRVDGAVAHVELALTVAGCPLRDQLRNDTERLVGAVEGIDRVEITMGAMSKEERAELMSRARKGAQTRDAVAGIPAAARVLAVVSGKGGVGKSSVTANLAVALAARGLSVGLLDGDIWGFSIPRMLGVDGPLTVRNKKMLPKHRRVGAGVVKVVSMGFLSDETEAIMWRGLVLNRALQHFLEDVDWGSLDYLLVDMPPGTGDVQMGLARMIARTELLVVTTPAIGAQKVASRAADMARKGHLRIAGVIENMSSFECEHGRTYQLFGEGGGRRLAEQVGAPLLAEIPLDPAVSLGGDEGTPVALDRASRSGSIFFELATQIVEHVAPPVEMSTCSACLVDAVREALDASAHT